MAFRPFSVLWVGDMGLSININDIFACLKGYILACAETESRLIRQLVYIFSLK